MFPGGAPMGARFWTSKLFIFSLTSVFSSIAWHVQFYDYAVVNQPVNGSSCCHWILEDHLPFAEGQVAREEHAPAFMPMGQQRNRNASLTNDSLSLAASSNILRYALLACRIL